MGSSSSRLRFIVIKVDFDLEFSFDPSSSLPLKEIVLPGKFIADREMELNWKRASELLLLLPQSPTWVAEDYTIEGRGIDNLA